MSVDVVCAQRVDQSGATLRVRPFGTGELVLHFFVAPQRNDEALQDVADPADAEGLAAFDARDRSRVAGHDGHTKVRPQRFRNGTNHGPPSAVTVDERHVRRTGYRAGVIVFNDEELGTVLQDRAKLASAPFGERGSGWVLRPRRDHDGRGRGRVVNGRRKEAFIVHGNGHRDKRERVEEIGNAGEARILDQDAIAGAKLFAQHAFDTIQRPADDGDGL